MVEIKRSEIIKKYNLKRNDLELIELAERTFKEGDNLDFLIFTISNSYDEKEVISKFNELTTDIIKRISNRLFKEEIQDTEFLTQKIIGRWGEVEKGNLILTNIRNIGHYSNVKNKLIIMRSFEGNINGCSHRPDLAPSEQLFFWFLNNRHERGFFNTFKDKFLKEMKTSTELRNALIEVDQMLTRGEDVVFGCTCSDYTKCHRNILGDFYALRGIKVLRG